jgi:CBS domain-containing protein
MHVKVVMQSPITVVDIDAPVAGAVAALTRDGLGYVPVVAGTEPVGVLSDAELRWANTSTVRELAFHDLGQPLDRLRVHHVMRSGAPPVGVAARIADAARLMDEHETGALAVTDGGRVVGLVRRRDLLDVLVRDPEGRARSRLEQILTAVAGVYGDSTVLATALAVARYHRARLTVLDVLVPVDWRMEAVPKRFLNAWQEDRAREGAGQLALLAARGGERIATELVVTGGAVVTAVLERAMRHAADLIVLDTSTAVMVSSQAPCPVLAVSETRSTRRACA